MTGQQGIRRAAAAIALACLVILIGGRQPRAQSYTIAPSPFLFATDATGRVINNACVWTYAAGTTTPATTYSDNAGTPNQNPIRSNAAGLFQAYLLPGTAYKFVYESSCTPPSHGTALRTADNIAGVPASAATVDDPNAVAGETISAGQCVYLSDGSGGKTAGQWFKCDSTNTYSSTTPSIGIALAAIASTATGTVRLAGPVPGLSSLSVGSAYYVSTAGAITTSAPANKRAIGHAETATSLVLFGNPSTNFALIVPTMTNGQLLIGSTGAAPATATPTAGNGISISTGAGTLTIAATATVKGYTTTNANVVNTTTETDAVSFTMPANEMADGDYVTMRVSSLVNCVSPGSPTITPRVYFGAGSASLGATNLTNGGVERKWLLEFTLMRVGADVWVFSSGGTALRSPLLAHSIDLEAATNVGTIAAPTFSNSNTVKLTVQFNDANANTYFKPQSSRAHRFF